MPPRDPHVDIDDEALVQDDLDDIGEATGSRVR